VTPPSFNSIIIFKTIIYRIYPFFTAFSSFIRAGRVRIIASQIIIFHMSVRPCLSWSTPVVLREPPALFIHARIRKVYIPNAPASPPIVRVSIHPKGSGVQSALIPLSEGDFFGCSTVLALRTIPTRDQQICFSVKDSEQDLELGRVVLPLSWFPSGKVVRTAYPLATPQTETSPMMAVDVHIMNRKDEPFKATAGQLRVAPTWSVPPSLADDVEQPSHSFCARPFSQERKLNGQEIEQ
jgi:hypothetical protein